MNSAENYEGDKMSILVSCKSGKHPIVSINTIE